MSLVEVMVVVTLSSILLGVVISLAVSLQQWDRRFRDHGVRSDQTARLAEAIRADVRRATDVSLPAKEILSVAAHDQQEIRYELRPEGCRRTVQHAGGPPERSELFTIGPAESWQLERGTPGRHSAVVVSIERPIAVEAKSGSTPFYVYAAVGGGRIGCGNNRGFGQAAAQSVKGKP